MNNREGGVLYIGVADDGKVVGVSDVDSLQKKVAERIRDNILPLALGLYDVTSEEMDGRARRSSRSSSPAVSKSPTTSKRKECHQPAVSFAWARPCSR